MNYHKAIPHYLKIHIWIHKNFGKAKLCEINKNHYSYKYEWSNISMTYKKDRNDWRQLCQSCHRKNDYPFQTRKLNKINLDRDKLLKARIEYASTIIT